MSATMLPVTRESIQQHPPPFPSQCFKIRGPSSRRTTTWDRKCKPIRAPILVMGEAVEEATSVAITIFTGLSTPTLLRANTRISTSNRISQALSHPFSNVSQDTVPMIPILVSLTNYRTRISAALNAKLVPLSVNLRQYHGLVQVEHNNSKVMGTT